MFSSVLFHVREKKPLIHAITNYVTANDCANILLACGASPVMADDPGEVAEITGACDGLQINLGTPNERTVSSMLIAGKAANRKNIPVVFDPVGVGASAFRIKTAKTLLRELHFDVIRGNISEIRVLALGTGMGKGVDAAPADGITESILEEAVSFVKDFASKMGCVVAVTGATDVVTDGKTAYCIRNGHPMMSSVTGTGCQLSALTAAFAAANPDNPLLAAAAAVCAMGLAGEIAHRRLEPLDGNGSYRNYIIDGIYRLTPEQLEEGAKYEMR